MMMMGVVSATCIIGIQLLAANHLLLDVDLIPFTCLRPSFFCHELVQSRSAHRTCDHLIVLLVDEELAQFPWVLWLLNWAVDIMF